FGTGYSSLSYLKKFSIDILKIDQSFIRELTIDSTDANIASAIIQMGHSLNQKIVAEGVENETQLMFLCEQKCDFIQGYYFSKPLPVFKMTALLEDDAGK
ncbi:MAG: EAL domain-containing protein, partial [Methylococcales bacterium]|nr:EAL domain-containing protein [Methylococcales bacterium]